jgi:hypothetical protein
MCVMPPQSVQATQVSDGYLIQNIQKSNAEAANTEANLEKVFQQALRGSSELAASQTRQQDSSRELAVELQRSLENLRTFDVQALLGAFNDFHSQIVRTRYKNYYSQKLTRHSTPRMNLSR